MKSILFITLVITSFKSSGAELNEVIDVLKYVESEHNPEAIGDGGKAYGILQIHKIAVDDVNRVYGTKYTHQDAFNIDCAEEIFKLYVKYWSNKIIERDGRHPTIEDIVRIWNGGPVGYKKDATKWYLNKFLKYRKKLYICDNY